MAEEKTQGRPRVSRRDFLKVAGALAAVTLAGCGTKPSEPLSPSESLENQLGRRLQEALEKTKKAGEGLVVDGVTKKNRRCFSSTGETPIFCLPIGGDPENQFQIGFWKPDVKISPSYLAFIKNRQGEEEKYEAWDVLLVDLKEDLNPSWEFVKIGGWDEKRLEEKIEQNKDYLVGLGNRVALFCFNGEETQKINEAKPTGPTP